ncbi:MAG: MASE4 domain-containing protein [Acetobacteraceae bacterium]|nr:MASE4 domain-containing protein [Acetobacteraceae bacterium]
MSGGNAPPLRMASLSLVSASPRERLYALLVIIASVGCFLAILPFARQSMGRVDGFVPAYEAALCVNDLITSALLFCQFARLRSRALLALAAGYLFDAQIAFAHALTFPGAFSPGGLLGAGPQSAPWLYVAWHVLFPLFVLTYALVHGTPADVLRGTPGRAAAQTVAAVTVLVGAITALVTAGQGLLPMALQGDVYLWPDPGGMRPGIIIAPVTVLLVLGCRRRLAALDLWLMMVMAAWLLDVIMSVTVSEHRFDLAFYVGRGYGLLATCFVLIVLLVELNRLYNDLAVALQEAEARNIELVRSREEFARMQRSEALGQLVGGLAHDFNNLLTVMTGSLDMIQREPGNAMRVARMSWTALEAAHRGERLTRQLLSFARRQVLRPRAVDPGRLVIRLETFLQRAVGEHIRLDCLIAPGLWPVRLDVGEFEAALLNLVLNARDALDQTGAGPREPGASEPAGTAVTAGGMPPTRTGAGRVTILARNAVLGEADVAAMADAHPGDYVALTVRDTGQGMTPAVLARVFEPFFTTKETGRGSGLGLSQVYGFVTAAGGHVTIASTPGSGTTVTLYLPRASEQPQAEPPLVVPAVPDQAGGSATILLVEDDAALREVTVEGMETLGYTVKVARDARGALEMLRAADPIDVMFSDVVLSGGMNGAELAAQARKLRPELRVLLTTGYAETALWGEHGMPPRTEVLSKPYRRDQLAAILHRMLGR